MIEDHSTVGGSRSLPGTQGYRKCLTQTKRAPCCCVFGPWFRVQRWCNHIRRYELQPVLSVVLLVDCLERLFKFYFLPTFQPIRAQQWISPQVLQQGTRDRLAQRYRSVNKGLKCWYPTCNPAIGDYPAWSHNARSCGVTAESSETQDRLRIPRPHKCYRAHAITHYHTSITDYHTHSRTRDDTLLFSSGAARFVVIPSDTGVPDRLLSLACFTRSRLLSDTGSSLCVAYAPCSIHVPCLLYGNSLYVPCLLYGNSLPRLFFSIYPFPVVYRACKKAK